MYGYDRRESMKESRELAKFHQYMEEDGETQKLPLHRIVCPTCDGRGSHVNPSIDSHGLTADDFYEDPDFARDYMAGAYDVVCSECGGHNVVDDVDYERAKTECPDLLKRWEDYLQEQYNYEAECRAERRMGA